MYCICVLNIKVKKGFLSTGFRKHHTTYKRVLSKPEKGHNKKDDKSNNYLFALHFKYSTPPEVLICINPLHS